MVRKSPNLSATIFPIKTRRLGNDKNIWEVKKFKNSKSHKNLPFCKKIQKFF